MYDVVVHQFHKWIKNDTQKKGFFGGRNVCIDFSFIWVDYFSRWVTLANATAKAWAAENGYWKSNV